MSEAGDDQEKKEPKEIIKAAIDDNAFDALEKDFQEVLAEVQGNRGLDKFREEYEKIMRALKKSHDSEKRLMQKCRELKAEIVSNSAKVTTALKLSQDDQNTISSLKKEIEKAWKIVDAATEKENRARETIQSLKLEISNLTKLVEQGAVASNQDSSITELLRVKETLTKERDDQLTENKRLRDNNEEMKSRCAKYEADINESDERIQQMNQEIQVRQNEVQREIRHREKIAQELKDARVKNEAKNDEISELKNHLNRLNHDKNLKDDELKQVNLSIDQSKRQINISETKIKEQQRKLDQQVETTNDLLKQNQAKSLELKTQLDDVNALKTEISKLTKLRETSLKKLHQIEDQKGELERDRDELKRQIGTLGKDLDALKREQEAERKKCDQLTKERDQYHKQFKKAELETAEQEKLAKLHEDSKKTLEQDIQNFKEEAEKQRKIVYQLEKERDNYINEASDLTQKVLQHMEDVKIREMKIFDYKKKIAEADTKLRQQQNLYEAVRSDRNVYSKNLIEAQDEITEMKRKLKIMTHQINQLKDEIQQKESSLVDENVKRQRVEKEKEQLTAELQRMKKQAEENKAYIEAQEAEQRKLMKIIVEADAEKVRQKKDLDQVLSERDILGNQLVRRNDELHLLYEKIKIQQSILNKGEVQYNQRVDDIRVLKLEIKKLRREKGILNKTVANVDDLRREVYHLQRELLRERTRCKALEEELENPMNVHRWRKLEGSDPSTYEMIQKIQTLQKRLIYKTEEVVEKELLIQEKEKLYVELKHILSRQPGPEVAEQLSIYQSTLKQKNKQLKTLTAETNMYESQIKEYKFELEKLSKEYQDVKRKFFLQKKREQNQKEKDHMLASANGGGAVGGMDMAAAGVPGNQMGTAETANLPNILPQQRPDQNRFTGGGFNLSKVKV